MTLIRLSRLKLLETEAYSQKEAEAAAGMGSYIAPKKRKVETQQIPEAMQDDETLETGEPGSKRKKVKSNSDSL